MHVAGMCPREAGAIDALIVHREIAGLVVLGVVVVAGFFLTRAAAATNRTLRAEDAAAWHEIGRLERAHGETGDAVQALRRAVALNRGRVDYRLDLADALAAHGDDEASRQLLLELREAATDSPAVDIRLARLSARSGPVERTVRDYQHALQGAWREEDEPARRRVRIELIQYLLSHDRRSRALSELIVASGSLPEDSAAQNEVANLLREAGDPERALTVYRRVLAHDPKNLVALEGAGITSFEAGEYAGARRFLRGLDHLSGLGQAARTVSELVFTRDPLRRGLDLDERRRRLTADLEAARDRLDACLAGAKDPLARRDFAAANESARGLDASLRSRTRYWSRDDVDASFAFVVRVEQQTANCSRSSPVDEALTVIGRLHASDP
jgi:tetratricopeptide (TPR) repeat protein